MAADVDQSVLIDAYVRYGQLRGRPALEAIWLQALADTNSGVQVSSVTFEGASGSGQVSEISTAKLLVVTEQALQIIDGQGGNDRVVHAMWDEEFLRT